MERNSKPTIGLLGPLLTVACTTATQPQTPPTPAEVPDAGLRVWTSDLDVRPHEAEPGGGVDSAARTSLLKNTVAGDPAGHAQQDPPAPKEDARAQAAPDQRQAGDMTGLAGIGFTDGPDSFLVGFELDFWQSDRLAIGPMLQLGLDDNVEMFAPSLHAKYRFPLGSDTKRLSAFAQGGIGILALERDQLPGDDDDVGLMLQMGGGIEFQLESNAFLASTILIDLMPDDVLGENAIFTWQLVQVGWKF
jgi:hypothetical protein